MLGKPKEESIFLQKRMERKDKSTRLFGNYVINLLNFGCVYSLIRMVCGIDSFLLINICMSKWIAKFRMNLAILYFLG
jgi:hypothetical protein